MQNLQRLMTLLFLSALPLACGDSAEDNGDTSQQTDGGAGSVKPDGGGKPASGSAVVYTGGPSCDGAGLNLQGTVDGHAIEEVRMLGGAVRLDTSLRTLERNYDPDDYDGTDENLNISWDTPLTKGQVSKIGEGMIRFPKQMDVGPYCVSGGKIGFDPMQPSEGDRIQFVIASVRAMEGESCTGAELPADLKGCLTLFRLNQN